MSDAKSPRTGDEQQTRYQELLEHAKAGARVSEIISHDPQADATRAAIEFANINELGGEGHWLNELRGETMGERRRFLADAFASKRITEATSYWDGLVNQWKFHIGFWYASSSTGPRHDCAAFFETDVKRAIGHAHEMDELLDATKGFSDKTPTPKPAIKTRPETM